MIVILSVPLFVHVINTIEVSRFQNTFAESDM